MANGTAQTRDGRKSLAYILEIDKSSAKSAALAKGDMVVIVSKCEGLSGSAFGDIPVNHFFVATAAITMKTDTSGDVTTADTYYTVTKKFCGFATGKSVSESKNVTESTIDYDKAASQVTDGIVTKSGSVSGALITEDLEEATSALNPIKQRFDSMAQIEADGSSSYAEAKTTIKDVLMIVWNGRDAETGDLLECEIIPVLFSNLSKGGEYGSDQSFDVDFSGNYTDDNGFVGDILQIRTPDAFIPVFLKTERTDYNAN